MAQPFFHDQQRVPPPGFGIDDPVRIEPGRGEARRKQVLPLQDPEDGTGDAREDAGGEQGRSGAVFDIRSGPRDLVHRRERQSATGQGGIDAAEPERQRRRRGRVRAPALEPRDGIAELVQAWGFRGGLHGEVRILFYTATAVKRLGHELKRAT